VIDVGQDGRLEEQTTLVVCVSLATRSNFSALGNGIIDKTFDFFKLSTKRRYYHHLNDVLNLIVTQTYLSRHCHRTERIYATVNSIKTLRDRLQSLSDASNKPGDK